MEPVAFNFAFASAGKSMLARMAMMAITTSNSIKVNAWERLRMDLEFLMVCLVGLIVVNVQDSATGFRAHRSREFNPLAMNLDGKLSAAWLKSAPHPFPLPCEGRGGICRHSQSSSWRGEDIRLSREMLVQLPIASNSMFSRTICAPLLTRKIWQLN